MPIAGVTDLATLTLDVFDSTTTAAALKLTGPAGVTFPAVTRVDTGDPATLGSQWAANVTYPTSGVWYQLWTVTGTGAGEKELAVAVDPSGPGTGRRYATSADLGEYLRTAPPLDADRLLRDATQVIDQLLITAVYPTDTAGMPTTPAHVAAMRDAACELVNWWLETGDPSGALSQYTGVGAGSISLSRAIMRSSGGKIPPSKSTRIGEQVFAILSNAGLLGHSPWTY